MTLQNIFLSEANLGHMFLGVLTLLFSAHLFGQIFNNMRLPRVAGEICGGIVLGPSGMGAIYPEMYASLFNAFPEEGKILSFFYWMGFIFLLFTAGFNIDRSSGVKDQKIISNLVISATLLPMLGGVIYCYLYDFTPYQGTAGSEFSMSIIVCISIAVTSIPVISKIFIDLDIINSRFAKVVLATSTIQ
ncbi:MAG: cation:proton antiporter, partial [Alphaproteobacteria bacterium]|nr:cation:proton antiporter [Alphaproteobacteria bacterium]